MPVYVDDMYLTEMGSFRGMKMSHMVADTEIELLEMAQKLGLKISWYQSPPKVKFPHFDIAMTVRKKAIQLGAVEVTMKEALAISKKMLENKKLEK